MNIALVSQYFWPESFIINDLVKCLVREGHTVEVFTGKPNYPDGEIYSGYSQKGCDTEIFSESVKVHRVPLIPRGKGGAKRLLMNYLSFIYYGLRHFSSFIKAPSFDVILVMGLSPITSVIPAMYLKHRLKIPMVVWVQDLWPESLRATGFVKNPVLLRLAGWGVRCIYKSADQILVQSEAFIEPVTKYAAASKIVYYPNSWSDTAGSELPDDEAFKELLTCMEQNICFVFAGNFGHAQAMDTLLLAAERIKHLPDCKIILVGSGSKESWILEQKRLRKLEHLLLPGRFPATLMPHIFARAAGLLVTLRQDEILSYTVPSKIQAYLAAGRPLVAALDGEGARVVKLAGAGLTGAAEDAETLAANIEKLYHCPSDSREKMGAAGRAYFLEHFEMKTQTLKLIDILQQTTKNFVKHNEELPAGM